VHDDAGAEEADAGDHTCGDHMRVVPAGNMGGQEREDTCAEGYGTIRADTGFAPVPLSLKANESSEHDSKDNAQSH
jgi:hypothetical protein